MIVTSVQIKTAKTQKHLYCPVFTEFTDSDACTQRQQDTKSAWIQILLQVGNEARLFLSGQNAHFLFSYLRIVDLHGRKDSLAL